MQAFSYIDIIMRGECEQNITPLITAIGNGQGLHDIPGITFRDGAQTVRTVEAPPIAILDDLPLPDYSLIPNIENYGSLPIEVGRGCPFRCTFCSTKGFFQRHFRFRNTEHLMRLIVDLHGKYGISRFRFIHDNVTVSRKKMLELCNGMKQLGLDTRWTCSARADCLDRELIDRMADAGCDGIFLGIETGSKRMQRVIRKSLNLNKVTKAVEWISSKPIPFTVSFIMGFPDETLEDLEMTIRLMTLLRFKGDGSEIVQLHMLSPAPGTEMYEEHKSNLFFDGHVSDAAFAGSTEDMRIAVENHPEVFASFGYYGTKHLNRQFLLKVNFVFLSLLYHFPYTTLALMQSTGSSFPGQLLSSLSLMPCPETVWLKAGVHIRVNTVYPFLKACLHELGPRKEMVQEVLLYEKTANDLQYDIVKHDARIIRRFRYDVEGWIARVTNGAVPGLSDLSRSNARYILFLKNDGKVKTLVLPSQIGTALTGSKKLEY
jgi:pyruvate-formate lyase-activating enzyme